MTAKKTREERFTWQQKKSAVLRQLQPYRARITVLIVLEVIAAAGNGVVPYVTGKFFDALITPGTVLLPAVGVWPLWAGILALWALIQAVTNTLGYVMDRKTSWLTTELEAGVQARAYAHLLTLPVSFLKKHRAGEISNTIDRSGWMLTSILNSVLTVGPQLLTVAIGVAIDVGQRARDLVVDQSVDLQRVRRTGSARVGHNVSIDDAA